MLSSRDGHLASWLARRWEKRVAVLIRAGAGLDRRVGARHGTTHRRAQTRPSSTPRGPLFVGPFFIPFPALLLTGEAVLAFSTTADLEGKSAKSHAENDRSYTHCSSAEDDGTQDLRVCTG